MSYDSITNTVIALGESNETDSQVMISDDGGDHWFEVGYKHDESFVALGWDGIYKWPDWIFSLGGGVGFAYGWWFIANREETNAGGDYRPTMIRISPSGEITEPVYPPEAVDVFGELLLVGGDVT
jgi:hypothetical protein